VFKRMVLKRLLGEVQRLENATKKRSKKIILILKFATDGQNSYIFLMNKKSLMVQNVFIVIALLISPVLAQRGLTKGEKNENVKSDKVSLNGSVFCGYEFDGTDACWSMSIKVTGNNKELYEVVWTLPLQDQNYRDAEKLVLTSNDGKKIKFLRVNNNWRYEAEIDSKGNLVNGVIYDTEKQDYVKNVWSLLKVK
jgi:hypothetical protein